MKALLKRATSIYKNDGIITLLLRILRKTRRDTKSRWISVRGQDSFTLAGHTVAFSAPNKSMVNRNRGRFVSEKEELQDFIEEIESGDVVYDIGANTGLYTLFAAKACPDAEVVAFEPYAPNYELLEQDIERNRLKNVEIVESVLSNVNGTVKFSQPSEADVGYGSSSIGTDQSNDTVEVPSTTGDQLVDDGKIPNPNIVKIDVEGSEPLVIEGLEKALSSSGCRTVYCEVHLPTEEDRPSVQDFNSSIDDIKMKLSDLGFTVDCLDSREREVFLKARKGEKDP